MPDSSFEVCKNVGLPTYLKEFIEDEQLVTLVLRKKHVEERKWSGTPRKNNVSQNASRLDLTGSPLKIELNGDDELEWTMVCERFPLWTQEESRHAPLSMQEARQFLRDFTMKTDKSGSDLKPVFCLCDASDVKKTVVLGLSNYNQTRTYSINIVGCFPQSEEVASIEHMKKEHLKNVRARKQNVKIDFLISKTYFIFGSNLRNCPNVDRSENNGSVSVKISSKEHVSELFENYSNIEVNLQVILGHHQSPVHSLWEELEFIHKLIDILKDASTTNLEAVDISDDPLVLLEISNQISNCFSTTVFEREERKTFDLGNLRDRSILDLLWDILKRCRDVADLQVSFHILFEELADLQSKIQIPLDNESRIANILIGLINGTLAVPTITFCQALEFLIELGLEYLKNDYMAIISHFCSSLHEDFLKNWNASSESKSQSAQSVKRKTRTVLSRVASIDTTDISRQHLLASRMHTLVEFLFLSRGCHQIFEDNFEDICATLYNHFMSSKANLMQFSELQLERMREFSFSLNHINKNAIEGSNFCEFLDYISRIHVIYFYKILAEPARHCPAKRSISKICNSSITV